MPDNEQYFGFQDPTSANSDRNALDFMMRTVLSGVATTKIVKVMAVTNAGDLSPVGTVDVLPLVNMIDGAGNAVPHITVYKLPYMRVQGGANAVILDPQVGDLGFAVFCDRDSSSVRATKGQANPGSRGQHDMSDGIYVGGILNGVPTQYVRFSTDGVEVVSPTAIVLRAPAITLDGPVTATSTVTADSDVIADGVSLHDHVHSGVTTGSGDTGGAGVMRTLLLDQVLWDLCKDADGNIACASEPYAIAQDVASAIRLFAGELWYDTAKGIPYFSQILGKLPPVQLLRAQFEKAALSVPGVAQAQCTITSIVGRKVSGQIQVGDATVTFVASNSGVITNVGL